MEGVAVYDKTNVSVGRWADLIELFGRLSAPVVNVSPFWKEFIPLQVLSVLYRATFVDSAVSAIELTGRFKVPDTVNPFENVFELLQLFDDVKDGTDVGRAADEIELFGSVKAPDTVNPFENVLAFVHVFGDVRTGTDIGRAANEIELFGRFTVPPVILSPVPVNVVLDVISPVEVTLAT